MPEDKSTRHESIEISPTGFICHHKVQYAKVAWNDMEKDVHNVHNEYMLFFFLRNDDGWQELYVEAKLIVGLNWSHGSCIWLRIANE